MTDLTALIDRLDNALYYAEPRQTVKLRREVAEAIRDALAALPAPHVPKQEPAALDRQTMVRALVAKIDALEAELARRPQPEPLAAPAKVTP